AGAKPVFVPFERPDWTIDPDRLRKAFNSRTKAIIVNTPHNPTGRVLTRDEIATWPGMRERTITVSSLSKTFSCTGWRIGWIIAPPAQTAPIRKVHDFLTVGAPAPLQTAAAVGFAFDAQYYNHFTADYKAKREF